MHPAKIIRAHGSRSFDTALVVGFHVFRGERLGKPTGLV